MLKITTVNCPENRTVWFYNVVIYPKDSDDFQPACECRALYLKCQCAFLPELIVRSLPAPGVRFCLYHVIGAEEAVGRSHWPLRAGHLIYCHITFAT